jgi:hypothetical protein
VVYGVLGQNEKSLGEAREAFRLNPASAMNSANVVSGYISLNRLEDARAAAAEARTKKLDSPALRSNLYQLAFLQNDAVGMAQQVAWAAGKPEVEDVLLNFEADTAAYFGKLRDARDISRRAVASAVRAVEKEVAAAYETDAALREAMFGNAIEARQRVAAGLGLSNGSGVQFAAALALACTGDTARAQMLADDLDKHFPENIVVQFNYLPAIRAQLAMNRGDNAKAVNELLAAVPYGLGGSGGLYVVYVRGAAYLAARQGNEAAGEFQKILDHRGIVGNELIGALAHLQMGRAYAMLGETAKARAAYQGFLTPWKNADPDIPLLVAAKSEYAKLQ